MKINPNVESDETEKTHKAPRRGNLEEDSLDETSPDKITYQEKVQDFRYSN